MTSPLLESPSDRSQLEPFRLPRHILPSRYDLTLEPHLNESTFDGHALITVQVLAATRLIVLNSIELDITSVFVDGQPAPFSLDVETERLFIGVIEELQPGIAMIDIVFTGILNDKLRGFYRSTYVDENGQQQVVATTQMQSTDCRRAFPCFDEPDFKAVFSTTLISSPDHLAISNGPEISRSVLSRESGDKVAVKFADTMPMSTYLVAFVVGKLEATAPVDVDGVPLRIVHTPGKGHLTDFGMDVGVKSLRWFVNYYGIPYPDAKIDMVALPDFAAGAMENVGCITYRESLLLVDPATSTQADQQNVADVVSHELAHMWFGDLVTMKWWDDLWLNESFAEWAAHHASVEATQYTEAWVNFVNQRKSWGYRQDQLPTTHPIVADMFDLDAVEVNFDGITYAKGASALRQLVAWVGEDAFFTGIRAYFKKHAWGNTELQDLLVELEQACGRSLTDWTQRWLQTAGVNTLRPEIVVQDGKYKSVTILQEPPVAPDGVDQLLRPHHIGIGLYSRVGTQIKRDNRIEIDVDGARTDVPELVGQPVADLMLLNDGDYTFVKIRLDENSAKTSATGLRDIEDGVARALIWGASWDMTRDAEMSASDYLSMVINTDLGEIEIGVAQQLLLQARSAIEQFANPANRAANRDALLASLLKALAKADAGGDHQLAFVKNIAGLARTPQHVEILAGWLDGSKVPAGLEVDTDLRWSLVARLVALGGLPATAIEDELVRDNTAGGQRQAASAKAGIPTAAAKLEAWKAVVENDGLANALLEATVGGFSQPDQRELLVPFVDKYFDSLADIWETRTNEISQTLTLGLFPSLLGSPEIMAKADAFIASSTDVGAIRLVRELRDNVDRSLRCQARDGAK